MLHAGEALALFPFLEPVGDHFVRLLQIVHLGEGFAGEPLWQPAAQPFQVGAAQLRLFRTRQPLYQKFQKTGHFIGGAVVLQPEQGCHQVVDRLPELRAVGAFVNKQKRLLRLKARQPVRRRLDQGANVGGRPPAALSIVEHHRQHRRQFAVGAQFAAPDQVLMEQPGIDHDAQRHEAIHRRLELQQQVHIEPLPAPAQPPHRVAMPAPQVVGNVAAVHFFQGRQVQRGNPGFGQEAHQQLLDHPLVREKQLVDGVVLVHGHLANQCCPAWPLPAELSVLRRGQGL